MKTRSVFRVLVVCLVVALWGLGAGATPVDVRYSAELGTYLTGADGLTLYLFTPDEPGKSTCYGGCAAIWPPFIMNSLDDLEIADNLAGAFSLTERTDGTLQVVYNGWPLYYWIVDKEPGDTTGHAVDDVWFVVNPAPTLQRAEHPEHGTILVDAMGMTLYMFGRDSENVSNCSGTCAINWPPLIVSYGEPTVEAGIDGEVGLITREDGAHQVTYNGMPLYGWIADQKPGDTTGHGVGGNWFVVNP